jgi:hypothetical protein
MLSRCWTLLLVGFIVSPLYAQFGGGGGGGFGGGGIGGGGGGLGGGGMGGGGVYLDAEGVIRALKKKPKSVKTQTVTLKDEIAKRTDLRQVSLRKIDAQLRKHLGASGKYADLPEELRQMAGLHRIDYIVIDRANKDVLLCGPAEGWIRDIDGRAIGKFSKRPALDVADIAAAFRCVLDGNGEIKCSIDPLQSGLANLHAYEMPRVTGEDAQAQTVQREVEEVLGMQKVTTGGIPEGSRFARAIVDADYRMKRMAMGLDRVAGLFTHADAVANLTVQGSTKTNLARWWFTPAYDGIECDADETTFRLVGQGMKLLNEEVLIDEAGARTGTGKSNPWWDRFSQSFTRMLPQLEKQYSVFADLHNLYDLTMVAGIVKKQGCSDWFAGTTMLDAKAFPIPTEMQPKFTEPVVTTRIIRRNRGGESRFFLSVALGGVSMNPNSVLSAPGFMRGGGSGGKAASSSGGSSGSSSGGGGISSAGKSSKPSEPIAPVARLVKGDDWWSDAN